MQAFLALLNSRKMTVLLMIIFLTLLIPYGGGSGDLSCEYDENWAGYVCQATNSGTSVSLI